MARAVTNLALAAFVAVLPQHTLASCKDITVGNFRASACGAPVDAPVTHKCLLTLPGKGNEENFACVFNGLAADNGIPAVAIQFTASPDSYSVCASDYADPVCGYKIRHAKEVGGEGPKGLKVPVENSVEERTRVALLYLANKTEGKPAPVANPAAYARCLTGDQVKWSSMIVAGGSEGSGQAAFVGHMRSVDRVIQFSGMDDVIVHNFAKGDYSPVKWATTAGQTPPSRYYGFGEVYDQACRAWFLNWGEKVFKQPGGWINIMVAKAGTKLTGRHKICSDLTHSTSGHLTPVWDKSTPKTPDGKYLYEFVWRHLLGLPPVPPAASGNDKAGVDNATGVWAPEPIKENTAIDVTTCDEYPNIMQLWAWDAASGTLQLTEADSPKLVLDCGKCTNTSREMTVKALAATPTPSQKWIFERGHFVNAASGLCLARNPSVEPGLVLMADCAEPPLAERQWSVSATTHHVSSGGVCLSAHHANTTRCQCVY